MDVTSKQLWNAQISDGMYQNPIIYSDYSDPDVIRVGEDYYMVSSSFAYVPGVPLLHSRDLVHWELINYCVRHLPFERYTSPQHGCGTWAPSIRYHNETFYVFVPLPDEGIFVTSTQNVFGEWTPLKCVKQAKGWIDPCPLWDDDGNVYMVHAFAQSRCGIKHKLGITRLDPCTLQVIDDDKIIFDGTLTQPTAEGPKIYKHSGKYYIFIPAGGVATGWQTVLRSDDIYGPYEEKIVMHQGNTTVNGPHQGAWVNTSTGEDYFVHFQDANTAGRIVHLQPMCWSNGWPFIGVEQNGDGIGEPVAQWKMPSSKIFSSNIPSSDDFTSSKLGLQWQWQANEQKCWYECMPQSAALRLFVQCNHTRSENLLWYAPHALTQMLQAPRFSVCASFELVSALTFDSFSFGFSGHSYSYLSLVSNENGYMLQLIRGSVTQILGNGEAKEELICSIPSTNRITVCAAVDVVKSHVTYSVEDNGVYSPIGEAMPLSAGTWTGARFVICASNTKNVASTGYVDVRKLEFSPIACDA